MSDASQREFYLCPPTYFQIEYVINDWMDLNVQADKDLAEEQWQQLLDIYKSLGVSLNILEAKEGMPDLVFPGDAIFLYGEHAVASNFRHAERAKEVAPRAAWFEENGFTVHHLPKEILFEGNAEAVLWNGKLLGGYGVRSDKEVYPILAELLDIEIVPLKVNPPFFHLDVAVCPLNESTLAIAPDALDQESCEILKALAPNVIEIGTDEANLLGINSMSVDNTVILSTKQAPKFSQSLRDNGFEVIELEMSEFRKSGGGVKCLTLEHYKP